MVTTAEIMATAVDAARVGVVNVLRAEANASDADMSGTEVLEQLSDSTLDRAVEVVSHYAGPAYGRVQLDHDVDQLANLDMVESLKPALEVFTEVGKIQLLRATLFVVTADDTIDAIPYGAAAEFGLALGLTPEHVRAILQRYLDDHMPTINLV